jgi:DNA-binding MarR family transcriptional regulator
VSAPAPGSQPLVDDLCWLLARASHSLTTELTAALEDFGLTPRGHQVLSAALSGENTQTDLARIVGLDKTTMVVTLDDLESAGLAERRPAPGDRRVRVIAVTTAGKRRLARADEVLGRIRADVLSTLPPAERTALVTALQRLVSGRLAQAAPTAKPVRRRAPRRRTVSGTPTR